MSAIRLAGMAIGMAAPGLLLAWAVQAEPAPDDREREVAGYMSQTPDDPVARLQKAIDAGSVKLTYSPQHGYLPSLLRALKVPLASQGLVFSKTSFQLTRISARSPRAVYFGDDVYVGWVQGSDIMELSAVDPKLGAVFYTLNNLPGRPKFVRQTFECLQCHESAMTAGIPGHIVRSVYPAADGQPDFASGTYVTTDESPLRERFGGWYVTGKHGVARHMGNAFVRGGDGFATLDRDSGANKTDLRAYFDTAPYLSPHSDLVALMVLTHQTRVHNLITKARWQTLLALADEKVLNEGLGRPADYRSESTVSRVRSACRPLLEALLFAHEAPLDAPIQGTTAFARTFAAQGPTDSKGRSLRQLDLTRRLFRYPCSFLIYSESFDALPPLTKGTLWKGLDDVLTGREKSDDFKALTAADRQTVREILLETKPEYAAWAAKNTTPTP